MMDALCAQLEERLKYQPGERDMVVLFHELVVDPAPGSQQPLRRIRSSLVDFGTPSGYTSMAKTVGLPAAIAADLLLKGTVPTSAQEHAPSRRWPDRARELSPSQDTALGRASSPRSRANGTSRSWQNWPCTASSCTKRPPTFRAQHSAFPYSLAQRCHCTPKKERETSSHTQDAQTDTHGHTGPRDGSGGEQGGSRAGAGRG